MTTAHTQHGLIVDNSDGSDRDAPIVEPFSTAEFALGIAVLLWRRWLLARSLAISGRCDERPALPNRRA